MESFKANNKASQLNFFRIIFLLPGTILHEFLHFFVGFILNAKPIGFTIMPRKSANGYILGSVTFKNITFYNAFPIAIAPVFSIIPALYLFGLVQGEVSIQTKLLYLYLIWTFLKCSLPSTQDIKVMFMYPVGILFYSTIIYLGFFS